MRQLPTLLAISTMFFAACGDDGGNKIVDAGPGDGGSNQPVDARADAPPVDADPNLDFSCYGNTAPTTAPATVAISGTAQSFSPSGGSPLGDVAIKACKGDCTGNDLLASTTSANGSGVFTTGDLPTGGAPLSGYLVAEKTGSDYLKTYVFPAAPLAANLSGVPVAMITHATLNQLSILGVEQDPANGIIGLAVTDCSTPFKGVTGATVTVKQGGVVVGDDTFDVGSLAGEQAAGTYLVPNVPPGQVEITVTYAGMTFLANTVTSAADAETFANIRPGY